MSTVQEIEGAIERLSPREMAELSAWMDERLAQAVDVSLKADLDAGRFDDDIRLAREEHRSGKTRSL